MRICASERLNHLQALEAESLYILREAVAEFARPVMLYSIGKDSSVMLRLAQKETHENLSLAEPLLTDGLKAEREQGITIDVAYRYFSTTKRKFIIADTPGHKQYTRNMATGASTADVAIVLVDAKAFVKLGRLLPQSRRHTYIASLLRIPHVVAAVNKMDLVDYSAEVFDGICSEFTALAKQLGLKSVEVIPVSALVGDNVVERSWAMDGYEGPTLLEYLETVPRTRREAGAGPLRFPVQLVVRPNDEFLGVAGRVVRGEVHAGMRVRALPSGRLTRVKSIVTYDGELYDRGYTSIGCEPCTAIPEAGADARSGRWGGKKLECGIHTFSEKQ